MSETEKFRSIVVPYLKGNGVDIGSGGDPVIPDCISFDLPESECVAYNGRLLSGQVNFRGDARFLPFKFDVMDWVFSSHLLEDYSLSEWPEILAEWIRVLKPGGVLVILIPDKKLWAEAVAKGQPPNCAHKHEGSVGELTQLGGFLDLVVERDEQVGDYSIIFVARKKE